MRSFKQALCRQLFTSMARCCCLFLAWVVVAQAAGAQTAPAAPVTVTASAGQSPEAALAQSVQQWVARQQGARPEQVQLVPLDTRVKVQPCKQALVMDLPFASTETIRVRCPEPVWQIYMRLQVPLGTARAATGQTPGAGGTPAEVRRSVVVAELPLVRGMTVQASDLRLREVVLPAGGSAFLDNVAEALHSEILRDMPAGTPLRRSDLRPLVLVKRGQLVQLSVGKSTGFMVTAHVEALQDGRMGEQIKLKNADSGRVLTGVVRGPNMVEGL
jgi:flagella basal body P-ring formation protein FlgA